MEFETVIGLLFFGGIIGAGWMYMTRTNIEIISKLRAAAPNAGIAGKPGVFNSTWVAYLDGDHIIYEYCNAREAYEIMKRNVPSTYGPSGCEYIFKSATDLREYCERRG